MSRALFKFSKPPDGLTRRVMFMQQPAWPELSAKLESLYGIPKDDVGVSYVDSDGDEVTLSSDEELTDFYRFNSPTQGFGQSGGAMKAIRFTVRDLSSIRAAEAERSRPATPESSHHRNTFGLSSLPSGVFEGDDWQHVNAFGVPQASIFAPIIPEDSPAPHAFLEVVESDVSMSKGDDPDDASSVTQSDHDATPTLEKGKARAISESSSGDDDIASTVAMVEEDAPRKPPVHVRDASFATTEDIFGTGKVDQTAVPPAVPPVHKVSPMTEDPAEPTLEIPDPPLPDLGDIPSTTNPTASLANDIAGLLNAFTNAFAAHPELSEGMRNLIRNATQGTYWTAHREAMSQAAEEIRRGAQRNAEELQRSAAEMHRAAEEAAGRRVAEAVASMMRAFGQFAGPASTPNPTAPTDRVEATPTPPNAETTSRGGHRPWRRPNPPSRRETWHWGSSHDSPASAHRSSGIFDWHSPSFTMSSAHRHPGSFSGLPPPPLHTFGPGIPPPPPVPPVQSTPAGPPPHPNNDFQPSFMFPYFAQPPMPPRPHTGPVESWPPPPFGLPRHFAHPPMQPTGSTGSSSLHPPPPGPPPPVESTDLLLPTVDMPIDTLEGDADGASTPSTTPSTPKEAGRALPSDNPHLPPGFMPGGSGASPEKSQEQIQAEAAYASAKEGLQKAKEAYRKEKEKYRRERSMKRADKIRRANMSGDSQPSGDGAKKDAMPTAEGPSPVIITPDPQLVSNARGTFPRIELESVSPRRHHTVHGLGGWSHGRHHHHGPPPPPPNGRPGPNPNMHNPFMTRVVPRDASRAVPNITRRLADMGFTPATNPELPSKILARAQRMKDDISREAEDAAVADVLEELLAKPASAAGPSSNEAQPAASGSGLRRSQTSLPGSWL